MGSVFFIIIIIGLVLFQAVNKQLGKQGQQEAERQRRLQEEMRRQQQNPPKDFYWEDDEEEEEQAEPEPVRKEAYRPLDIPSVSDLRPSAEGARVTMDAPAAPNAPASKSQPDSPKGEKVEMKTPAEARRAFIYSEIFNRKYE
ncbi:hypothetical protein [uncultured Bacteroides sp.]|uniref:hypothetical protein n=1 Tax=uncultured Bacteroides sp. TaxID=162156 RepID=UPI002612FE6E|nr:hypothetical protein [uncultured Bacteroides sp.]